MKCFSIILYLIAPLTFILSCNSNPTSNQIIKPDSVIIEPKPDKIHQDSTPAIDSIGKSKMITLPAGVDSIDSIIYAEIWALPEYHQVTTLKADGNVTTMISARPDSDFKYYWVQVTLQMIRYLPCNNGENTAMYPY